MYSEAEQKSIANDVHFSPMDVIELRRQEADAKMLRLICRWAAREGGDPVWLAFRLIERADKTIAWERKRSAAAIAGMRKLPSNMPQVVHSAEELAEAARFAPADTAPALCNENELAAAAVVRKTFRENLAGENPERDWRIMLAMATGASERELAVELGVSRALVRKRRDAQLAALTRAMQPYTAEPAWQVPISANSVLIKAAA